MRALKSIMSLAAFIAGAAVAVGYCETHPTVEEELKSSAVVVVGKVISTKNLPEPGGFIRGTFYWVKVAQVLKGNPSESVELYSENSSGRFRMQVGVRYLIFAYHGVFEGIDGRRLAIDSCGNSAPFSKAGKALATLNSLAKD